MILQGVENSAALFSNMNLKDCVKKIIGMIFFLNDKDKLTGLGLQ